MPKHNAAIYLLSSRKNDLYRCLEYLHKNWNYNHGYPIYVNHFDDIYDEEFIDNIRTNISKDIHFEQILYEIPKHIPESELFYNRKYLQYVRKSFPPTRIGYLHMEHYVCNIHNYGKKGCLSKELNKFDYLMRIDDDSWFKSPIEEDMFDYVQDMPIATAFTWNHCGQGHLDTRENLWNFYLSYLQKNNISAEDIKDPRLKEAVTSADEMKMHVLPWTCGNLNIYNMKMLIEAGLDDWILEVNKFGGTYKHRWGDLEVLGLFAYTNFKKSVYNLKLREAGLYEPKLPSSGYAPSTLKKSNNER